MSRRKPPSAVPEEDVALFREAIGPVRRTPEAEAGPERPRPAPRPRQREADEDAMAELLRTDPFALGRPLDDGGYRRDSVPPRVLRRLRGGQYRVEDEIDLHGMDARTAARAIGRFLAEARHHELRCVRIIHGKGEGRPGETPVLRGLTDALLRRRGDVLAFASGPAASGGSGATRVLLAAAR